MNTAIQILIGIDSPIAAPEELEAKLADPHHGSRISLKSALGILQRVAVTLLFITVSILVPEFSAASMHIWQRRVDAFTVCVHCGLARDLYPAMVVVWGMDWVPRGCTARVDACAAHTLLSCGARKCEARVDVCGVPASLFSSGVDW
jgi:hypothetical protein